MEEEKSLANLFFCLIQKRNSKSINLFSLQIERRSDNEMDPRWIDRLTIFHTAKLKLKLAFHTIKMCSGDTWMERQNSWNSGKPKMMNCRLNIVTWTGWNWPSPPPTDPTFINAIFFFFFFWLQDWWRHCRNALELWLSSHGDTLFILFKSLTSANAPGR
jgi:hypothetical protein